MQKVPGAYSVLLYFLSLLSTVAAQDVATNSISVELESVSNLTNLHQHEDEGSEDRVPLDQGVISSTTLGMLTELPDNLDFSSGDQIETVQKSGSDDLAEGSGESTELQEQEENGSTTDLEPELGLEIDDGSGVTASMIFSSPASSEGSAFEGSTNAVLEGPIDDVFEGSTGPGLEGSAEQATEDSEPFMSNSPVSEVVTLDPLTSDQLEVFTETSPVVEESNSDPLSEGFTLYEPVASPEPDSELENSPLPEPQSSVEPVFENTNSSLDLKEARSLEVSSEENLTSNIPLPIVFTTTLIPDLTFEGLEGSTEADHSGNDHMDGIESNSGKQEPVSDSVQLASTSDGGLDLQTQIFVISGVYGGILLLLILLLLGLALSLVKLKNHIAGDMRYVPTDLTNPSHQIFAYENGAFNGVAETERNNAGMREREMDENDEDLERLGYTVYSGSNKNREEAYKVRDEVTETNDSIPLEQLRSGGGVGKTTLRYEEGVVPLGERGGAGLRGGGRGGAPGKQRII